MTIPAAEVIWDPRDGERRRPNGARLREARLAAGLDQRTLAARLAARVGEPAKQAQLAQHVCRLERGTTKTTSPTTWAAIVAELKTTAASATM